MRVDHSTFDYLVRKYTVESLFDLNVKLYYPHPIQNQVDNRNFWVFYSRIPILEGDRDIQLKSFQHEIAITQLPLCVIARTSKKGENYRSLILLCVMKLFSFYFPPALNFSFAFFLLLFISTWSLIIGKFLIYSS